MTFHFPIIQSVVSVTITGITFSAFATDIHSVADFGDYVIDSSSEQNGTTLSSVLSELQSGFYVEFKYSQPQTLTYANGEVYHSVFNSSRTIEFTSVYFALSNTDEFSDLNMYVSYKTSSTSSTNYVIKITQKANTYALYENRATFRN